MTLDRGGSRFVRREQAVALRDRARGLRRNMTSCERRIWSFLRGRRLGGFKFRRQHPMMGFILDFYCFEARLAVEIDGDAHDVERDSRRDAILGAKGIEVLRISNTEVERLAGDVLERILRRLEDRVGPPICDSTIIV